jgi:catechol 2,3-dioxygenase-like lactoylglutathione lyase family enzyme
MTLRVGMATIDCENPQRLADFYCQALEMQVLGDYDEFIFLGGEDASISIGLQKVPEPRTGKNRMHLDLRGEPPNTAAERMVGLGATIREEHQIPGLTWIVLADPEGNQFCIGEHTD